MWSTFHGQMLQNHANNFPHALIEIEHKNIWPLSVKYSNHGKMLILCNQKCPYWGDITYWELKVHCHFTGKFSSAAHSICNLKYSKRNSSNYAQWIKLYFPFSDTEFSCQIWR